MHERDPGPLVLLEGMHQSPRGGAGAADEDPVPGAHDRDASATETWRSRQSAAASTLMRGPEASAGRLC
jgi:hypothetical protein